MYNIIHISDLISHPLFFKADQDPDIGLKWVQRSLTLITLFMLT